MGVLVFFSEKMSTSTLLATDDSLACVLLSGVVRVPSLEEYRTKGTKELEQGTNVVLVNLCSQSLQFSDLPWPKTQVYDIALQRLIQTSEAGSTVRLVPHPHSHWKQRLSNFCKLELPEDDCIYVAFIDKPPSDEIEGERVDVASLIGNARKRVVVLQDDAFYIVPSSEHCHPKKMRVSFEEIVLRLVTDRDAFFDVSPLGIIVPSGSISYLNYIFGALKHPPVQTGRLIDIVVPVPDALCLDNEDGVIENNDVVTTASFGPNSKTMNCRVRVQDVSNQTWQIVVVTKKDPSVDLVCDSDQSSAELLSIIQHISKMRKLSANSVEAVAQAYEMMMYTAHVHETLKKHQLLMTMWHGAIQIGIAAWGNAHSSMLPLPPVPRVTPTFNAIRAHSHPAGGM